MLWMRALISQARRRPYRGTSSGATISVSDQWKIGSSSDWRRNERGVASRVEDSKYLRFKEIEVDMTTTIERAQARHVRPSRPQQHEDPSGSSVKSHSPAAFWFLPVPRVRPRCSSQAAALGRHGGGGATPVPRVPTSFGRDAHRRHGGHNRRLPDPCLAVAGADGLRPPRLAQLGPPRQPGPAQCRTHPP